MKAKEARTAREEMPSIVESMEAEEVRVEEGPEKLLSNWDCAKDFGGREGRMEKESELNSWGTLAEESWEGEEVVVVRPDEVVVGRNDLHDAVGEELVGGEISKP